MAIRKRLYDNNMEVLMSVLTELSSSNISDFRSKQQLLIFIEEIKFPHMIEWREKRYSAEKFANRTTSFYSQRNYEPIIDWLLERGVLTYKLEKRGTQHVYKFKLLNEDGSRAFSIGVL